MVFGQVDFAQRSLDLSDGDDRSVDRVEGGIRAMGHGMVKIYGRFAVKNWLNWNAIICRL